MGEVFGVLLVFAFLAFIFSVMFRGVGGRVGRPPKGVLTRLKDPQDSPVFAAALAAYALGKFVAEAGSSYDATASVIIGFLAAILVSVRSSRRFALAVCSVLAAVLAVVEAVAFVRGEGTFVEGESFYRLGLMLVVLLSFVLGAFLGRRDSAIAGPRGVSLLALVEISTFLADPVGRGFLAIDQLGNGILMAVVAGIGVVLGWAVSEFVLGVVVVAIAVVAPVRGSFDVTDMSALTAGATAILVLVLVRPLTRGR